MITIETFPIFIKTYVTAVQEIMDLSLEVEYPLYLYRRSESGYVIDSQAGENSNEKLVLKVFKGHAQ
jgi:hypothetical protein